MEHVKENNGFWVFDKSAGSVNKIFEQKLDEKASGYKLFSMEANVMMLN